MNGSSRRASVRSPLVVVLLAGILLVGSGGGAVAGAMITGAQIKNNTVTTKDLKNGSVSGKDVKDGSLGTIDISDEARIWSRSNGEQVTMATNDRAVLASQSVRVHRGLLHIQADLHAYNDATAADEAGWLDYYLRVDGKRVGPDFARYLDYPERRQYSTATGFVQAVVPVSAGSHVVDLVAFEGGNGSVVNGRTLTVTYVAGGGTNTKIPSRQAVHRPVRP